MSKKRRRSDVGATQETAGIAHRPGEQAEIAAAATILDANPPYDEVAALAYKYWQQRGCPAGSDQEDWFRAERELKNRSGARATAAGS